MTEISVVKLNIQNQETWRYSGTLLRNDGHEIFLEANFNRADMPFHGILLRQGDRFEETYYTDRWYNIFCFHEPDGSFRNYYCNINMPPAFAGSVLDYVDLDIDVVVWPDGGFQILDEAEYEQHAVQYSYPEAVKNNAASALAEVLDLIRSQQLPTPPEIVKKKRL